MKRLIIGTGIFVLLELIAIFFFYLVLISTPIENVNSIKAEFNGVFFYLLIGVYGLSTGMISLRNSIDLSKKLTKKVSEVGE